MGVCFKIFEKTYSPPVAGPVRCPVSAPKRADPVTGAPGGRPVPVWTVRTESPRLGHLGCPRRPGYRIQVHGDPRGKLGNTRNPITARVLHPPVNRQPPCDNRHNPIGCDNRHTALPWFPAPVWLRSLSVQCGDLYRASLGRHGIQLTQDSRVP